MLTRDMNIADFDPELFQAIQNENQRQEHHIELIASENYCSPRVLEAQGSQLTNKYAEGYPHKRYYGGCEYVDIAEDLAIEDAFINNKKINDIRLQLIVGDDDLKQMIRDVVRDTVRDVVREELKSSGIITEGNQKVNETLSLRVDKHVFEGKVLKVKKVKQ